MNDLNMALADISDYLQEIGSVRALTIHAAILYAVQEDRVRNALLDDVEKFLEDRFADGDMSEASEPLALCEALADARRTR